MTHSKFKLDDKVIIVKWETNKVSYIIYIFFLSTTMNWMAMLKIMRFSHVFSQIKFNMPWVCLLELQP
jgi:hypothetical protein